jgi:UDP-N-acetylmuramoyl-L-alanyl-D-glutamate--2,6-diaminopimelate ligase
MKLATLFNGIPCQLAFGSLDQTISGLTDDSRTVSPGCLFLARRGSQGNGRSFISDAIRRGATAILSEDPPADPTLKPRAGASLTWIQTPLIDQHLAGRLAERFFAYPSRTLRLIGVTGTNGKTTTTFLIQHLLHHAGVKCGLIGTISVDDGNRRTPSPQTTPGAIEFSRLLAAMAANHCQAAVAEVSSHALHQGRTSALSFDVAVFTNLTGDHLDYHPNMDEYAAAKAILFERLAPTAAAVMNANDPYAPRMLRNCSARALRCTVQNPSQPDSLDRQAPLVTAAEHTNHDRPGIPCSATILELGTRHTRARFDGPWGSSEVTLPLVGWYNVANALQAVAAAYALGSLPQDLTTAFKTFTSVPGRLEPVTLPNTGRGGTSTRATGKPPVPDRTDTPSSIEPGLNLPTVLVDYAHTPDALEKVLSALRPTTRGRLIVVFGCGGDRDRTKRPRMAAIAHRLADHIFITSDNPRTEDPQAIIHEILAGLPDFDRPMDRPHPSRQTRVIVEPDRAAAIAQAIASALPSDTLLLAGKGHEDYQIIGTEKRHFDDREHAIIALRQWARTEHRVLCP